MLRCNTHCEEVATIKSHACEATSFSHPRVVLLTVNQAPATFLPACLPSSHKKEVNANESVRRRGPGAKTQLKSIPFD